MRRNREIGELRKDCGMRIQTQSPSDLLIFPFDLS